jgi:protein TonB
MKQLLLTVCLTLAALTCSAQNAEVIEEKLNEYGRILNSKQNIYYFIGDDGKVTDVVMSSTIDYDMQQEITEFFKSLPPFSGGAGRDMVTIVPSSNIEKSQGYVSQNLSGGDREVEDKTSNRVLATADAVKKQKEVSKLDDGPQVYDKVEKMPYVIGGKAVWAKYLEENKTYPAIAKEFGAQDRVLVSFIVERNGKVSHVTPVKSCDPYLEREAVRLIQGMPKWMPGVQSGTVSRVRYTLAIPFRLN